jgi:hypothetical protein
MTPKQLSLLREGLEELWDMADNRADCDCVGDPPRFIPNAWMQARDMVEACQALLPKEEE